jgi:hypothetical protein
MNPALQSKNHVQGCSHGGTLLNPLFLLSLLSPPKFWGRGWGERGNLLLPFPLVLSDNISYVANSLLR